MKKRFLIHCSTAWCGMDAEYSAIAENEFQLEDLAEELAYDNFLSYSLNEEIAEDCGYDPDEMTDEDWNELWEITDETNYYNYYIEEYEGDEEDWQSYGDPYEV